VTTFVRRLRTVRRLVVFAALLALLGVTVPDATSAPTQLSLLKLDGARGLDATDHVVWLLGLGSDARPGQPFLGSRSDAIQLVGINTVTHHAVTIGVPRDSYVDIPGHGRNKINAAMVYGGPQLAARAVADLTGITPDYVLVTDFPGLIRMVGGIHGIRAKVTYNMDDQDQVFHPGQHTFTGVEALAFARIRHGLPGGDFDRSMDQGQLLKGGLGTVLGKLDRRGFFERALGLFARYTDTNMNPVQLYQLARTVLQADPNLVRVCVLHGGTGYVGAQSVVFPDLAATRSLVRDVRHDATLDGHC
jgi:polyisoprenyl-teichoic acid--peptidoglycan teichoic acid transferase